MIITAGFAFLAMPLVNDVGLVSKTMSIPPMQLTRIALNRLVAVNQAARHADPAAIRADMRINYYGQHYFLLFGPFLSRHFSLKFFL